jgi:DNA adenine methylase
LSDSNPYLIAFYQAFQQGYIPPVDISRETFNNIRANKDLNPKLSGFVGFAYSYCGKFFEGYFDPTINSNNMYTTQGTAQLGILTKQFRGLSDPQYTEFNCLDYKKITNLTGCIIYCDPPYQNTKKYAKVTGGFDHVAFIAWAKELSKTNIVLISEYKHNMDPAGILLFEKESISSIGSNYGRQKKTTEVLYTLTNPFKYTSIVDKTIYEPDPDFVKFT